MSQKIRIKNFIHALLSKTLQFKNDMGLLNKRKSLPFLNLCEYFADRPHLLDYKEWASLLTTFAYVLNKRVKNTDGINPTFLIECKLKACKAAIDMCVISSHQMDSYYCKQLMWTASTLILEWFPHLEDNSVNESDKDLFKCYVRQLARSIVIPSTKENVLHIICSWTTMLLAAEDHFTTIPNPKTLEIMIVIGKADVNFPDKENDMPLDKLRLNFEKRVNDGVVTVGENEKRNAINCARILNHHNGQSSTPVQEIIENIRNVENVE